MQVASAEHISGTPINNADQCRRPRRPEIYRSAVEQVISNGGLGNGHIKEVFIQKSLVPNGTLRTRSSLVPLLGAEHALGRLIPEILPPYFAFGDLFDLTKNARLRRSKVHYDRSSTDPEPFAWHILKSAQFLLWSVDTKFRTSSKSIKSSTSTPKPENIFLELLDLWAKQQSPVVHILLRFDLQVHI